jgi:hypothetical protein
MARILPEETLDEEVEFSNVDSTDSPEQEEQPVQEQAQEQPELPDKYRDKSIEDVVRMHQEAEKLLGKQSSEVGELRKIVDDFVKAKLEETSKSPQQEVPKVDFFEDPEKAVDFAIANHPKIKEAEQLKQSMRQQEIMAKLNTNYPDYQEILQDDKFAEWVMASTVRQELYRRADGQYDYDAADELLSTWKERKGAVAHANHMEQEDRKRQRKAASTGSAHGSGEAPSKKIYRRADIIDLMQNNPDRYLELADEITLAYAERRVR